VAGYHEAMLSELVRKVATAVDRYRDGELDASDVDRVLFQYSRAAKEPGNSATWVTPTSSQATCAQDCRSTGESAERAAIFAHQPAVATQGRQSRCTQTGAGPPRVGVRRRPDAELRTSSGRASGGLGGVSPKPFERWDVIDHAGQMWRVSRPWLGKVLRWHTAVAHRGCPSRAEQPTDLTSPRPG
jgi:hypothetical protein